MKQFYVVYLNYKGDLVPSDPLVAEEVFNFLDYPPNNKSEHKDKILQFIDSAVATDYYRTLKNELIICVAE